METIVTRKRGRPLTDPTLDVWIGVQDAKERKRRQDRLAQRARRQRLRLATDREPGVARPTPLQEAPESTPSPRDISTRGLHRPSLIYALKVHNRMLWGDLDICHKILCTPRPATSNNIPASLQPTPLQLTRPHAPWIDGLPFPRMRDNIIILGHLVDLSALGNDITSMMADSVVCRSSITLWNPAAWVIGALFRDKWGYLMH